jgi:elongation factor Ts
MAEEISAASVMKLRQMSGQGMMDCKKAIAEAKGDLEEAMAILRKKGLATLAKRAERDTKEGKVICQTNGEGKIVAMATLCCETDFVANSEDFKAAAAVLGDYALACASDSGAENLIETFLNGKKFAQIVTDTVSKTGEKMQVCDYARYALGGEGLIGTYIHFNNKVGTMLEVETSNAAVAEAVKTVVSEIAMHIAAIKPMALDRAGIDPALIAKEREIAADQVKNKPANIIDKIVDGKINKFLSDVCLLEQPFVKDDSKTVKQTLDEAAKKAGGQAKIKRFVRFEIG